MTRSGTLEEIYEVSKKAVDIFRSYGLKCCLFGSAACALYGVERTPNDVDLVVLTATYDQEQLKRFLVASNDKFYLVPSRNPVATYRVLWYRLRTRRRDGGQSRSCKVDILVPGVLNIPDVPRHRVKKISGLPVMPLIPLLLLKLQGWSDHRLSPRPDMQAKQHVDVEDILELLDIAVERGKEVSSRKLRWLPASLIRASRTRARDFGKKYPKSKDDWEEVGL